MLRTKAGSTVTENGMRCRIAFDWLEEGGCIECEPEAVPEEGVLLWHCDYCGGGSAELYEPQERKEALLAEWPKATGQIRHECPTEGKS